MKSKLFLVLGLFIALSGCKVGCDAESVISNGLAKGISTALNCANTAQIQTDILSVVGKTNICSESPGKIQGAIAMVVCPLVAAEAVSLLGSQIPASWQCTPTSAGTALSSAITMACNLLPF